MKLFLTPIQLERIRELSTDLTDEEFEKWKEDCVIEVLPWSY